MQHDHHKFDGQWSKRHWHEPDAWLGGLDQNGYVKSVFVVHVGGTRCVTFSTANNMKIHVRITLNVEFIRTCIFLFLFYV